MSRYAGSTLAHKSHAAYLRQFGGTSARTLYRFDTRSPEEIKLAGGFKPWGIDKDLLAHANGITIESRTSAYVSTTTEESVAIQFAGRRQGYIYEIKWQAKGRNVNKVLGEQSPLPFEFEIAVPKTIKVKDIINFKAINK